MNNPDPFGSFFEPDPEFFIPGLAPQMPVAEYRSAAGFHYSLLKHGASELMDGYSRGHVARILARRLAAIGQAQPGLPEIGDKARIMGKLWHSLLLEPERFAEQFAVVNASVKAELIIAARDRKLAKAPEVFSWRIKEAQAWKKETGRDDPTEKEREEILTEARNRFVGKIEFHPRMQEFEEWKTAAQKEGKTVIDESELELARAMQLALQLPANKAAGEWLEDMKDGGLIECPGFAWLQFKSGKGARLKFLCDIYNEERQAVVDAKSTLSAHPRDFAREVYNRGYWIQAGFYLLCLELCGLPARDYFLLAQEKVPPYFAQVYRMPDEWAKFGRHRSLAIINDCLAAHESGDWAPRIDAEWGNLISGTAEELEPPEWLAGTLEAFA